VFWLNIKDDDSLKQSFAKIAKQILRDHPSASQLSNLEINGNLDEVVEAVKGWLNLPKTLDGYSYMTITTTQRSRVIQIPRQ
jgi:hypothetical protein